MICQEFLGHALEEACKAAGSSTGRLPGGYGIIDTACTKTCIGSKELKGWLKFRAKWLEKNRDKFQKLGGDFHKLLSWNGLTVQ